MSTHALFMALTLAAQAGPASRAPEVITSPAAPAAPAPSAAAAVVPEPAMPSRPERGMTLRQALEYARAHQPSILAARARLAAAEEDTRVPRALYLPRLAVTAQAYEGSTNNTTALFLGSPGVDLPRIGATTSNTTSWNPQPSTLAAIGVRQEVLDFGRIGALQALTDAQEQAERGRSDLARLDLDLAVESAYFGVQGAKRVRDAAEAAFQRAQTNRDTAAAGVRAGLRPPIDLTRADADLSRFDVARLDARANVVAAQAAFAAVVGVTDRTLDAAGEVDESPPAPSLDQAIGDALTRDPLVRERTAALDAQRASTRVIQSELRPDISLTSTLSGRAGGASPTSGAVPDGSGWLPDVPNWDVGLVFSWPLFDGGVLARASASRAREVARQLEIDEVKQVLGARVQQVYVELDAARLAIPALQQALESARANYAQAQARFRTGLATALELADAQALLAQAEVNSAVGRFRLATARARLGRVIAENL